MTRARKGVASFVLPEPGAMGQPGVFHTGPISTALASLLQTRAAGAAGAGYDAGIAQVLREWPQPQAAEPELDCHLADEAHDAFFRIARTHEAPAASLLHATLKSLQTFAEETPDADERMAYAGLGDALWQVLHELLDQPQPLRAAGPVPKPLQRTAQPLRRWLHGHQLFAVLTLGLVRQLHRVVQAADDESLPEPLLAEELHRMAALYRASALAFRFTADFDPAVYLQTIRPSMCEPYTPKGFSGTLSSDHGVLVKLLVGSRESLARASARCAQAYTGMRAAITAVYDDHKWVCARFDGNNGPSLRSTSVNSDNTAVDMLERFRTRRIAMLP